MKTALAMEDNCKVCGHNKEAHQVEWLSGCEICYMTFVETSAWEHDYET